MGGRLWPCIAGRSDVKRWILGLWLLCWPVLATAQEIAPRDGWAVHVTGKPYGDVIKAVKAAAKAEGLHVVTQAGPTGAAKKRGIDIPGNRVMGLFNNDFAVRVLGTSVAARCSEFICAGSTITFPTAE